jgi:hypothetical protein
MYFNRNEIEQIKAEAKSIARERIVRKLTDKIVNEELCDNSCADVLDDWLIPVMDLSVFEKPKERISDAENFREIQMCGQKIRVNRSGTQIQRLTADGKWKSVKIQQSKDESGRSYIQLPNVEKRVTKTPYLTILLCRVVMEAFAEKPEYIRKVENSKYGAEILHGLHLCKNKGAVTNSHVDNIEWVCEAKFLKSVRRRMALMKEKARMKN